MFIRVKLFYGRYLVWCYKCSFQKELQKANCVGKKLTGFIG